MGKRGWRRGEHLHAAEASARSALTTSMCNADADDDRCSLADADADKSDKSAMLGAAAAASAGTCCERAVKAAAASAAAPAPSPVAAEVASSMRARSTTGAPGLPYFRAFERASASAIEAILWSMRSRAGRGMLCLA